MKLRTWIMGACLGLGSLQLSAQNDVPADIDRFSYSYGVLLGKSFSMQGLKWEDIDKDDLLKGIQAMMEGKNILIDEKTANTEVQLKMQAAMAAKEQVARANEKKFFEENAKKKGVQSTASGLQYEIITAGTGAKPTTASKVKTHYHGTLLDGTVFDSSVERGQPASFGVTQVIKGWTEVLQLMPVGSKWRVYVPFDLGYGARGSGGKIGPYTTLVFEIELIAIE